MPGYYNRQGRRITLDEWTRTLTEDNKRVALTDVGDSRISTVWLGLDYGHGRGDAPVIFETLVFDGPLADEMDRYSTEAEARAGHEAMVRRVRKAVAGETCCEPDAADLPDVVRGEP